MLVEFLSQLKLCHLVDSTLKILDTSQTLLDLTRGSDNGSCYSLFFPSLINVDKPRRFDADYFNTKGSFGWLMRTKEEHQFFHNRFLHVLMLTLMNGCGGTETLCNPLLKSLNRQCIVWSTGICWNSNGGATILVDVVEQFRSLYVAVSLPGPQYQELTILQEIRKTFNQFCPSVDVEEFVIDPRQVCTLFNTGVMISSLSCIEISKLKNAVLNKMSGARDLNGKSVVLAEWTNADEDSCLAEVIGIENGKDGKSISEYIWIYCLYYAIVKNKIIHFYLSSTSDLDWLLCLVKAVYIKCTNSCNTYMQKSTGIFHACHKSSRYMCTCMHISNAHCNTCI